MDGREAITIMQGCSSAAPTKLSTHPPEATARTPSFVRAVLDARALPEPDPGSCGYAVWLEHK
eukprot:363681-Chlamydomonas_euryale.AAC.3